MTFDHMTHTSRLITAGILMVIIITAAAYYFQNRPKPQGVSFKEPPKLHYADDPTVLLTNIKIKAFYFAPRDRETMIDPAWADILAKSLKATADFYEFQFQKAVTISYDIYPVPLIGREEHTFYDGADTSRGNPHGLAAVREEIVGRAMRQGGDLYRESFARVAPNEYSVMAMLYEGVGASATVISERGEELKRDRKSVV